MGNMEQLHTELEAIMTEEYNRAAKLHGFRHHSPHEAHSVTREEFEETEEGFKNVKSWMDLWWKRVKENQKDLLYAEHVRIHALHAAAELIQVAAMAHKAMQGYETDREDDAE